jgi:lipopolysaccharide/colanic/teichoic acid biosynthesis glycosyltransferase
MGNGNLGHRVPDIADASLFATHAACAIGKRREGNLQSPWTCSPAKRIFDCVCVLLALPVLVPLALAIAAVVRITSPGPVLFPQKRVGRNGSVFTILKFRTMIHVAGTAHHPITTLDNQRLTPAGPFLRRLKLDELPQLANVLLGHMSLVGPRPKIPEHTIFNIPCRPGLTGMATLAFAEEEAIFARVPDDQLNAYYNSFVLPAKQQLDADYAARATFLSDLQLLVNSVLRRWNTAAAEMLIGTGALEPELVTNHHGALDQPIGAMPNLLADPAQVSSLGL